MPSSRQRRGLARRPRRARGARGRASSAIGSRTPRPGADEERRDQLRRRQPGFLRQRAQRRRAAQAAAAMDGKAHDAPPRPPALEAGRAAARRQDVAGAVREQPPGGAARRRASASAPRPSTRIARGAIDGEHAGRQGDRRRRRHGRRRADRHRAAAAQRVQHRALGRRRPGASARRRGPPAARADRASAARHCTASAPCAGAGSISVSGNTSVMCCFEAEPLRARRGPGRWRRARRWRCGRRGSGRCRAAGRTSRSGRRASTCAVRRVLQVPMRAPARQRRQASGRRGRTARLRPARASARRRRRGPACGVDRQVLVAVHRDVHSPASERALELAVKKPVPSTSASGTSVTLIASRDDLDQLHRHVRARRAGQPRGDWRACQSARALPRVPMRMRGHAPAPRVEREEAAQVLRPASASSGTSPASRAASGIAST